MKKEKKLNKKKLRKLLSEQSYTIEALEDEVEFLGQDNADSRAKLWEIIQENDRLTITYEPYRPPGDEHENLNFYDLIEENDNLTQNVLNKMEVIKELEEENKDLSAKIARLSIQNALKKYLPPIEPTKKKNPKAGVVSLDFWPPSDFFRLSLHKWDPGKSFQLCIGPFRFDWMAT